MMFIGNDSIKERVSNLTLSSLNHTNLFVGENGSGKHTAIQMIADKFGLGVLDITSNISHDYIDSLYLSNTIFMYLIDLDSVSIKNQNVLLKFSEEPPTTAYIMFLTENIANVIPTIKNRCFIWTMEKYTHEQLREFCDNEYIVSCCHTPGQVLAMMSCCDFEKIKELCKKIVGHIGKASVANILTLPDKFFYKEYEDNKFDFKIFLSILTHCIYEEIYSCDDGDKLKKIHSFYHKTAELISDCRNKYLNQRLLFESYLIDVKRIMR